MNIDWKGLRREPDEVFAQHTPNPCPRVSGFNDLASG
jgi:hypothetical protein